MLILDFLLAFAILMVAFSTIVSGLVEVLTRLLNLRSRNLRSSLDGYLETVLWPSLIAATGGGAAPDKRATLAALRDHLTRNMAVPEGLSRRSGPVEMLSKLGSKPWIERLSPEALVQRLAETDLGQRLQETVFETAPERFDALMLGFDRYMALSSERFRRNSNLLVFLVSLVFAFGAQVHFLNLVRGLQENPKTIEALIESQDKILGSYIVAQGGSGGPDRAPDVAPDGSEAVPGALEEIGALQKMLAERQADVDLLRAKYALPIGAPMTVLPACDAETSRRARLACRWQNAGTWGLWQLNVLLSGLLIGLGGPFWYKVTRQLSQARILGGTLSEKANETIAGLAGVRGGPLGGRNDELRRLFHLAGATPARHRVIAG
ncbi:MAG: hypothetical protein GYB53_17380 [Rhodobacteraceae bacterium]|nr:hypothetical protein [Paracoccaceae bacterium]MBR9821220.1 hypothetical protein [Paracoccaceae bacterium]